MSGPEGIPGQKSSSDAAPENGAASPAGEPAPSHRQAPRWQAPRWLLLVVAVVLVLGLLGIRALLNGGGSDDAERDLPSAEQVESAEHSAEEVLTTWARPEVDYDTWWKDLEPLLTPRAREGYADTDPRRIPDLTIDGDARVTPGPTSDTVTIGFATDQGTYEVAMYRGEEAEPWRAVQIVFPEQKSPFDE